MTRGRKRRCINRKLPKNLYRSGKAFRYRIPISGEFRGAGTNEAEAIKAAIDANAYFASLNPSIHQMIINGDGKRSDRSTMEKLISEFSIYKKERAKSDRTFNEARIKLNKYEEVFGDRPIKGVTVRVLAEWLDNAVPGYDAFRKHRILLIELFDFALGKGLLPVNHGNPAQVLLNRVKPPKTRQRLKLEEYRAIYDKAPDWLQVAMDLSLQTTLRLGDVLNLKFEDIIEKDLYVTPSKTRELNNSIHLKIKIGANLERIIRSARQSGIASPYIVHRRPSRHTRGKGFEEDCIKYYEAMCLGWMIYRCTTDMVMTGTAIKHVINLVKMRERLTA